MKKIISLLCSYTLILASIAQTYSPKDDKQAVSFGIKNFGVTVKGSFTGLQGSIIFNAAKVAGASFAVTVDAATINTDNGSRDGHLKKEEYFNVAQFKKISLVSSAIKQLPGQSNYLFEGVVTIKGTSKIISFPFTALPNSEGFTFKGSFKINRRDFKVGGSSLVLSDNLTVFLQVATKRN
jgi:polyisoprenoid-binding protein YceI